MLTFLEHGKTTQYHGISRFIHNATAIVLVADEDSLEVLALDDPKDISGAEAYVADTPCTSLAGVFVPYDNT